MLQHVGIFAAYLYDSVLLYAEALGEVLQNGTAGGATNGTAIVAKITNRTYNSMYMNVFVQQ